MQKWKVLKSEYAFNNKRMRVIQETVKLPNGKVFDDYFLWEVGDAAVIVPITTEGKIILVRQYKHGLKDFTLEFPAGMVNPEEKVKDTVIRELQEETGYTSQEVKLVGRTINNPSKTRGVVHIFLGLNCKKNGDTNFDETEEIEVIEVNTDELDKLIKEEKFIVNSSLAALFLVREYVK